jgi:hypothetical protein
MAQNWPGWAGGPTIERPRGESTRRPTSALEGGPTVAVWETIDQTHPPEHRGLAAGGWLGPSAVPLARRRSDFISAKESIISGLSPASSVEAGGRRLSPRTTLWNRAGTYLRFRAGSTPATAKGAIG